ncbi:hypothetical protein O6P43_020954 [Quillaja saponaria]|uniref:Uncharacterized protein n=1 Tax=Quillaja saponaria TaxID=32244 RepID=A0AAD7LNF7_QUISA|nr:hypothetical protein O6P43_020954 [Quillaja saponaria]
MVRSIHGSGSRASPGTHVTSNQSDSHTPQSQRIVVPPALDSSEAPLGTTGTGESSRVPSIDPRAPRGSAHLKPPLIDLSDRQLIKAISDEYAGSAKVLFGDRASTSGRSTSSTATSRREYKMAHEIDSLKNELSTTKSELTQKVDEMKNLVNLLVAKLGVDTSILMPLSSGNLGASSSSRHGGEVDLGQDDAVNNEDHDEDF